MAGWYEVKDERSRRHGIIWADDWNAPRFRLLTPVQRCVYVTLCLHVGRYTGECFPKQKKIAALVGVSERTVKSAIAALKALGYVEVERQARGRKRINVYRLLSPPTEAP